MTAHSIVESVKFDFVVEQTAAIRGNDGDGIECVSAGGLTHGAILSDEIQTPIGQLHKSVGGVPARLRFSGAMLMATGSTSRPAGA